ncbi:MAG: AMP-binding protein [Desulfobacterales bacterium]|nr:AMP-binding protein [Desulfobacterales bacterium]
MIKARIPAQNTESANLKSYDDACREFSWAEIEKEFSWYGHDRMNIITESIDRWADDPRRADHPAMVFQKQGVIETYTYRMLKEKSCQWANLLHEHGFVQGDRLITLLPPSPETFFAMAACARMGVIFCPIFATAGFYELEIRLESTAPKGVLTHPDLVEKLSYDFASQVEYIFLNQSKGPGLFPNETPVSEKIGRMPSDFPAVPLPGDTPLYMIFTSGSTRPPKGIVHTHRDMTGMMATARWVLDVRADTVLWTDADPAWVTGTVYSGFAAWLCGITSVVQGDPFTAANWYWTIERHKVTVWYTTPRIIRDLMSAGDDLPSRYDLSSLKHIATVGAPLVPDIFYWAGKHLNCYPHDNWWMTETGIICIANYPSMDIKPGAIGKPVPGIYATILDEDGEELPPLSLGELALKAPWPGMMHNIWQDTGRFRKYFKRDQWFVTGDIAICDEEGYFYHQGRNDDLLKAGGDKLIGPFEVEQILTSHPAVSEAAVISKGTNSEEDASYLKAFLTLKKGYIASNRLNYEIKAYVKANLNSDIAIREVLFLDALPKTRSGKLLRRVLRAWELGLPGGDVINMQE